MAVWGCTSASVSSADVDAEGTESCELLSAGDGSFTSVAWESETIRSGASPAVDALAPKSGLGAALGRKYVDTGAGPVYDM